MFGVDGNNLAWTRGRLNQSAADDQRFLVGERQGGPGLQGRQGRSKTDGSGDAVEDNVTGDARDPG